MRDSGGRSTPIRRHGAFAAVAGLCIAAISGQASAGGLWLYEQGTPDLGRAAAGRQAEANDAATASGNPAGMTRLKGTEILSGLQPLYPINKFKTDSATTTTGGDGGNAGSPAVVPSFYAVHGITDDLKVGLSLGSFVGGGLDYGDDWAGRYFVQSIDLLTLSASPTVAYRLTPWLSVGAGPVFVYSKLEEKTAVNNFLDPAAGDGQLKVSDDAFGYGGNFGILLEPWEGTRFGATYVTSVELKFNDAAKLRNIGPNLRAALDATGVTGSDVDLKMKLPQQVAFSAFHQLTDDVAIMADVNWQDWSSFGKLPISVDSANTRSFTADLNMKDTYHVGIGATYRFLEGWQYSIGAAYDTSAYSNKNRIAALPVDDQIRVGTGVQYNMTDKITLGAAYEYLNLGKGRLEQSNSLGDTLSGKYSTNEVHFVNVTLNWKF